jgi:hypothetical protein
MRKRAILAAGFLALLVVAVSLPVKAAEGPQRRGKAAGAKAFRSCTDLVRYARRHALRTVEPRTRVSPGPIAAPAPVPVAAPERGAAPVSAPATPVPDYSSTNVQELGVDEPDIVKTDGSRIFAVAGGKLRAVVVRDGKPRLAVSLQLEQGADHELLLRGDRLLVISRSYSAIELPVPGPEPAPLPPRSAPAPAPPRAASIAPGRSETVLSEIDVSNASVLRVVRTLTFEGTYVSSRLTGATARIVIASQPRILYPPVAAPGPLAASAAGTRRQQRKRLRRSGASSWVPKYVVRKRTGRKVTRAAVRCRAVRHAPEFSGLDMLTVLTVDLAKGLPPVDSDALMTDAQLVYASERSLYVATQRWVPQALLQRPTLGISTAIHQFDTAERGSTAYRASGTVPGFLLNQFSMSEYRGVLRVASTDQPTWIDAGPGPGTGRESESLVTVLDERAGKLVEIGRVGGLGHGERIHSVRFINDVGYVVTFRQIDPLYTVDLSAPHQPKVLGELKLLGYSAYLHPVGKDLLIGVGQDATAAGRTLGTQISLFDVSDLRRPARLHSRTVAPGSSSEVEYDHHAFLYWPPAGLAVVPVHVYGVQPAGAREFLGAIGFRISRAKGVQEAGRIAHDDRHPGTVVRRTLVLGDQLFTVSERGLKGSSIETLAERTWVPFE